VLQRKLKEIQKTVSSFTFVLQANYKLIKRALKEPKLIIDFIEGTGRGFLNVHAPYLIRRHIREQYEYRLYKAKKCLENKSCLSCGCSTPDLFFCTKPCDLTNIKDTTVRKILADRTTPCYDKLLNRRAWKAFKNKLNNIKNLKK
jgi:hypothetical protein